MGGRRRLRLAVLLSAVFSTIGLLIAPASHAEPSAAPTGPLGEQIASTSTALEKLGVQIPQAQALLDRAIQDTDVARQDWDRARAKLDEAEAQASVEADAAYRAAAALGPFSQYANDLRLLSVLAPGLRARPLTGTLGFNLDVIRQDEADMYAGYLAASSTEQQLREKWLALKKAFEEQTASLAELRRRNTDNLARVERERAAFERSLAAGSSPGANAGLAPDPRAVAAVRFALQQLGKAYEWGAEGPNTYDCSGLIWDAYRVAGVKVPRVAQDQYRGTTPVSVDQLVPGDLLYFAYDGSDWKTIHHDAIYIGNGQMLHAPQTGDVVKIAPIWWAHYFGATRVVPAVKVSPSGPSAPPVPPVPSPTQPPPSPPVEPSPSPSPSPSTSPSVSPSPSASGSATPTPSGP